MSSTYRVIYRGGQYVDTGEPPAVSDDVCTIVNLEVADGGDAYQQLLPTLEVQRVSDM